VILWLWIWVIEGNCNRFVKLALASGFMACAQHTVSQEIPSLPAANMHVFSHILCLHNCACTHTLLKKFPPFVTLLFMDHKVCCFALCDISNHVTVWCIKFTSTLCGGDLLLLLRVHTNCCIELFLVRQEPHFCYFDRIAVTNTCQCITSRILWHNLCHSEHSVNILPPCCWWNLKHGFSEFFTGIPLM